jgi:hypothetical protein
MRERWRKICVEVCLSVFFSVAVFLATKITFSGNVASKSDENYMNSFEAVDVLKYLFLCVGIFILLKLLYWLILNFSIEKRDLHEKQKLLFWAVTCLVLVLSWLPYLLSFAPGSVLGDSLSSIGQVEGGQWNNHHPVFYTFIVGIFIRIGKLLGSINIGVFLYSCFQYIVMVATLSYLILWMYERGVKVFYIVLSILFYAIMPFFPTYAIIMWKDPLFSISILWFSFLIFDGVCDRKYFSDWRWLVKVAITGLLMIFLRNNGLYIVVFVSVVVCIVMKKKAKYYAAVAAGIVLFSLFIQGPCYSWWGITKESVESLGIPIQQMAYVVVYEEEELSNEEKEILNQLMPLETWKEVYAPCRVDNIKWNQQFNTEYLEKNEGMILKLWVKMFPKHIVGYIKAYCMETLGFWHPYLQNKYGYIDIYISDNSFGIHEVDLFAKIFKIDIKDSLRNFYPQIGSGTFLWIMLFMMGACVKRGEWSKLLFYLPAFACWGTIMVATPVAFSLRYVYIFALQLPLYLVIPYIEINNLDKITIQSS